MLVRAAALVCLSLALAMPARAQLVPTSEALSFLALFGLAPHLATDHAHFAFNVGVPAGHTLETTLFAGLDGVPETVETGAWSVRPTLLMQGRLVGLIASVQLDLTSESEPTDSVTFGRTFGVSTRYHNGLNLAGLVHPDPPVMLTVGPALDVAIGSRQRVEHADGSYAQWGRLGDVQIAPSVGLGVLRGPVRMWALGMRYVGGSPWTLVNATTGEATGRWDVADPESPSYDPDLISAQESLQRVRSEGGFAVEAGATLTLGDASQEPRLALGLTAALAERDYSVAQSGFGVGEAFTERDVRVMVSVGIAIPPGGLSSPRR